MRHLNDQNTFNLHYQTSFQHIILHIEYFTCDKLQYIFNICSYNFTYVNKLGNRCVVDDDDDELASAKVARDVRDLSHIRDSWLSAPSSFCIDRAHITGDTSVLGGSGDRAVEVISAAGNDDVKAGRNTPKVELWQLPGDGGNCDSSPPDGGGLNFDDLQLNETLKLLMETKTPMLPSRLCTAVKQPKHSAQPPVVPSKPQKISTCAGFGDVSKSAVRDDIHGCVPVPRPGQFADTDGRLDRNADRKAFTSLEFRDASRPEFAEKLPAHATTQSVPGELASKVQRSAITTYSAAVAEPQLSDCSVTAMYAPALPLVVPDTGSLDSLISRYRSLRNSLAEGGGSAQALTSQTSNLEHASAASSYADHSASAAVTLSASDIGDAAKPGHSSLGQNLVRPAADAKQNRLKVVNSAGHVDAAASVDVVEEDLLTDNFDDIQCSLRNISMESDHAMLHSSSQPKGANFAFIVMNHMSSHTGNARGLITSVVPDTCSVHTLISSFRHDDHSFCLLTHSYSAV